MHFINMNRLLYVLRDVIGFSVAFTCISWVILHLISFSLYGSLLIGESNPVILLLEVALTITGLFCFLASFYEHRISKIKSGKRDLSAT
jgi:hypothetical protein